MTTDLDTDSEPIQYNQMDVYGGVLGQSLGYRQNAKCNLQQPVQCSTSDQSSLGSSSFSSTDEDDELFGGGLELDKTEEGSLSSRNRPEACEHSETSSNCNDGIETKLITFTDKNKTSDKDNIEVLTAELLSLALDREQLDAKGRKIHPYEKAGKSQIATSPQGKRNCKPSPPYNINRHETHKDPICYQVVGPPHNIYSNTTHNTNLNDTIDPSSFHTLSEDDINDFMVAFPPIHTVNKQCYDLKTETQSGFLSQAPHRNIPREVLRQESNESQNNAYSPGGSTSPSSSNSHSNPNSPSSSIYSRLSSIPSPFPDNSTYTPSSPLSPFSPANTLPTKPEQNDDSESDTCSETDDGNTFLHEIAFMSDHQTLKLIEGVEEDCTPVINELNAAKQTALYLCAKCENEPAVEFLLKKGADPNIRCFRRDLGKLEGGYYETPLHIACEKGLSRIVKLLLRYKSEINGKRAGDGRTPLLLALMKHSIQENRTDVVEILVNEGANLSILESKCGKTPLMVAIKKHALYIARMILEALRPLEQREQVTKKDYSGNTCLHMVAEINSSQHLPNITDREIQMFALDLTRYGADGDAKNNEDYTPKDLRHNLLPQIGRTKNSR